MDVDVADAPVSTPSATFKKRGAKKTVFSKKNTALDDTEEANDGVNIIEIYYNNYITLSFSDRG